MNSVIEQRIFSMRVHLHGVLSLGTGDVEVWRCARGSEPNGEDNGGGSQRWETRGGGGHSDFIQSVRRT